MLSYIRRKSPIAFIFIGLFVILLGFFTGKDRINELGRIIGYITLILTLFYLLIPKARVGTFPSL